jgi:hypothetical protein
MIWPDGGGIWRMQINPLGAPRPPAQADESMSTMQI